MMATAAFGHEIKFQPGNYLWNFKGGCGYLTVGKKVAYIWDKDCDGGKD